MGAQHQHRRKKQHVAQEQHGPRILSNFFCFLFFKHFLSSGEGSIPMLALQIFEIWTNCCNCHTEERSGRHWSKVFREVYRQDGCPEVHKLQKQRACDSCTEGCSDWTIGIPCIDSRILPSCWSWGWRSIEMSVRQFKRQMRAVQLTLEKKLLWLLANADPIVAWIPTFSGNAIARLRRGADGKTSS